MKTLLILGAGTGGTMMANHLAHELNSEEWEIVVVEKSDTHYYQPGYLFLPFGGYDPESLKRPVADFIPEQAILITGIIQNILPEENTVLLEDGRQLKYDILIIATGTDIAPQETQGLLGPLWEKKIFQFYTFEGAMLLRDHLKTWEGGKMVVHITEMPIKCPVAPLEFAFLADDFFRQKGMRDKVDITFVTPMSGAFTKPKATAALHHLLDEKQIKVVADFNVERIDSEKQVIIDYAEREVPFDLLVTIPTNMGNPAIGRSGLGDDLNYVPTHKGTLQSKAHANIFVIGDASNIPASKAGSVAHFESEILTENILNYIKGEPLKEEFDGHANCFVETGGGKALLLDFNYNHEPVEGEFPVPGVGPLRLLKESRMNHWGKLAFKWIYWNMLLKGRHIPLVNPEMQEAGKHFD